MSELKLPSTGLTILHDRTVLQDNTSKELPQIIQLNIVENVTKDILRCIHNNEQVRLKLGKKPGVQYGRKRLNLSHIDDAFPSEIIFGPFDGSEPTYFSGKLSHTLEVQRAKQDTAGTDEALAALENNLKSMKEHQASNQASFMGSKTEVKKKDVKPTTLSTRDRLRGAATPSSPFLGASPRHGPTSNPFALSAPSKEKIRQDAMRIPLVHLLATSPMSPKAIAQRLNASLSDCERVLEKVAIDGKGGNKELKDKCFRELDVWKFRYREEDRQAAIDRAIHAFDRMRIDKNNPLWQSLLPKEERGKGTVLSQLNFVKQVPPPATPKVGPDGETKAEFSDKEAKPKKVKAVQDSKDTLHKKKPSGDAISRKKVDRAPTKANTQPAKVETKFKSVERIEDSDEEAGTVEVAPARSKVFKAKEREPKAVQSPRNVPQVQSNGQHKSKLSSSSAVSTDLDKSRQHEDRTKLKARPQSERSPSTSRISPRPRADISPQKPSPLGSSPPTNSTDLENSSKASTQSSAPSSPPSSTDMPLSQARKNYSPVITGKPRTAASIPKRKGEKGEEPPAKRQQIHGLGLSKEVTTKLQQPTPERRLSGSSLSSPEKQAVTKESVVEATLDFQEYYSIYKALHAKLHRVNPDERSDRDLDKLWRMHARLEKLKEDLWSNWRKAGGDVPM